MATRGKTKVIGLASLEKKLANLPTPAKERVKVVLDGGGTLLREDMKSSMAASPATGKRYGDHVASSPGNPPRIDTSGLSNAIRKKKLEDGSISVGVFQEQYEAEQALALEFGTVFMEARPFATPAYIRTRPKIVKNVIKSLNNYLKTL